MHELRERRLVIVFNAHYIADGGLEFKKSLSAWLRRHRVEAARITQSFGPFSALAQDQESGCASPCTGVVSNRQPA
jgi:hypothetical protein